jgi:hypothetical protein
VTNLVFFPLGAKKLTQHLAIKKFISRDICFKSCFLFYISNMSSTAIVSKTPSMAKIVIRVINKDCPDNILAFNPDLESYGFNVTFTQPSMNVKNEFYLEYEAVVPYLETFFLSLTADTDPDSCFNVQVDMPGLPSVLLKKSGLQNYLSHVIDPHMDTLSETDWPMESATRH